jgi:hypothetical protein
MGRKRRRRAPYTPSPSATPGRFRRGVNAVGNAARVVSHHAQNLALIAGHAVGSEAMNIVDAAGGFVKQVVVDGPKRKKKEDL